MSKEINYDEALEYILDQHQLWLDTDGKEGTRLELIDKNLERVRFEVSNFKDAEKMILDQHKIWLEIC